MSVQVFVPLFKVGVAYVVRQGRAWTNLEHALLWTVNEAPTSLDELVKLSNMPVRLVIQSLLELMTRGWVSLNTSGGSVRFEATLSGAEVAPKTYLPAFISTATRTDTLCLDRLVGSALDPDDLTLVHVEKIPKGAVVLAARTFKPEVRPGDSIERLYMLEDETFEDWVDHRLHSPNFYAALRVSGDTVTGLPPYASLALHQAILEELAEIDVEVEAGTAAPITPFLESQSIATSVCVDDLVVGGAAHKATIIRVLEQARSTVVIHSCFVSPGTMQEMMPLVHAAAKRGVQVDMLWGLRYEQAQDWARRGIKAAREAIAKLPADIRSRVRFSDRESGSHAKIIIADSGPHGAFEGFVGSCNWLATKFDALDVSLRLRDPRLLGALAAVLATLRIPAHGEWNVDVHRLLRLRVQLGKQKPLEGSAKVSLIFDREHLALVRLARDRAAARIVSACDLLGPAGETSVFVPMRTAAKDGVAIDLIYNRPTDNLEEEVVAAARRQLEVAGVNLTQSRAELHGKFLVWDDESLCVTSFNWLATTPDRWKPRAAEVGVFVAGADLNADLLARINEELAVSPGSSG